MLGFASAVALFAWLGRDPEHVVYRTYADTTAHDWRDFARLVDNELKRRP